MVQQTADLFQFQGISQSGIKVSVSLRYYSTLLLTSTSTILYTFTSTVSSKHSTSWHQIISAADQITPILYLHLSWSKKQDQTKNARKDRQCQHSHPALMLLPNQRKHSSRSYVHSVNDLSYCLELHSYRWWWYLHSLYRTWQRLDMIISLPKRVRWRWRRDWGWIKIERGWILGKNISWVVA
jgi:hypothetical protein